jgi:RNA 2',3'-cyclic 3'-phosphodiesterase
MFVALDLPDEVSEGIGAWGVEALSDPALRPAPPGSLHVTLAFLGYRPEKEVERLTASIEQCVAPPPLVELRDPVARPARGRPRLFVLPVLSPGTESMQARLSEALVGEGLYEPEGRPFWPHVTVARARPQGRGSRRPMRVERLPGGLPASLAKAFYGVRITLYRSELKPQGARYESLAQFELSAGGRQ